MAFRRYSAYYSLLLRSCCMCVIVHFGITADVVRDWLDRNKERGIIVVCRRNRMVLQVRKMVA